MPPHIQILINGESIAFIFKPIACYSYNKVEIGNYEINVATIDTMLSFYLVFIYADRPYFDNERILCMAQFLFDVEQKNRLNQRGLLKRFSVQCYGKQSTLESVRAEKAEKFKELMNKRNTPEWNEWFFKYSPSLLKGYPPKAVSAIKLRSSKSESKSESKYKQTFIDPKSYETHTNSNSLSKNEYEKESSYRPKYKIQRDDSENQFIKSTMKEPIRRPERKFARRTYRKKYYPRRKYARTFRSKVVKKVDDFNF